MESAAVLPTLPLSHGQIAEQEQREAGRQPYSPFIADGMLRMLLSLIGHGCTVPQTMLLPVFVCAKVIHLHLSLGKFFVFFWVALHGCYF